MQSKTTIGIVAVIVIALIVGAYAFDHRFDDEKAENQATSKQKTGYIQLDAHDVSTKSDISAWTTYNNSVYKFSLKYPPNVDVRKLIDGKDEEYGIAFTMNQPNSLFAEKYFELVTEVGKNTVCDALIDSRTSEKTSNIGDLPFIRREYNDGTSHVIEYVTKPTATCYRGYLRLNNPTDNKGVAANGDARSEIEAQVLEDIMSTVRIAK